MSQQTKSVDELIQKMNTHRGTWHVGSRQGNDGNAGNTLEDLLGVEENNLQLPDYGEVEIKTQRAETGSLLTLFHKEPAQQAIVPKLLICLGWKHKDAGFKYPNDEMSFRSTTQSNRYSDRGFTINYDSEKIYFDFDPLKVNVNKNDATGIYEKYGNWLEDVMQRQPNYKNCMPVFWYRNVFDEKCSTKLDKTLFVICKTKTITNDDGIKIKHYRYDEAYLLSDFNHNNMGNVFDSGELYIDFDARTRHNHGTKLRIKSKSVQKLFNNSIQIF